MRFINSILQAFKSGFHTLLSPILDRGKDRNTDNVSSRSHRKRHFSDYHEREMNMPVKRRRETHSTSSFFSIKNWSLSNIFNYITGTPIEENGSTERKQELTKNAMKQRKRNYSHYGSRSTLKRNHLKQISKAEVLDLTCLDDSESDGVDITKVSYDLTKPTLKDNANNLMNETGRLEKRNHLKQISKAKVLDLTCLGDSESDDIDITKVSYDLTKSTLRDNANKLVEETGRLKERNHLKQISKAEVLDLTCLDGSESDDIDITKVSYDLTKPSLKDHANNLIKEIDRFEERNHLKQISKAGVLNLTYLDDSESDDIDITKVSYDLTKPSLRDHANNLIEETGRFEERNPLKQISKAGLLNFTCLDDSESDDIDITKVPYDLTKPTPRDYAVGSIIFSE